jgi:hypothetical protein
VNSNSANTVFSFSSSSKTTENYHSPHRHQHQGGSDAGSDTSHGVHETSSTTTEKRRSSSHRFVSTTATTSGGGFRHLGQQQHRACDKKSMLEKLRNICVFCGEY